MVSGFRNGTVLHLKLLQPDDGCFESLPCGERLDVVCPGGFTSGFAIQTCSFLPLRGFLKKLEWISIANDSSLMNRKYFCSVLDLGAMPASDLRVGCLWGISVRVGHDWIGGAFGWDPRFS